MSKEYLEAFGNIIKVYGATNSLEGTYDDFLTIKKAFKRLESIDNANPSEALKIVDKMANYILLDEEYGFIDDEEKQSIIKDRDTIKQALLKAQEQEKVLKKFTDLIDTKNVDIKLLKWAYPNVEAYNVKVREQKDYWRREELTKEEFEFIGRMVNAK